MSRLVGLDSNSDPDSIRNALQIGKDNPVETQTSHNIDCALGSLCYIRTVFQLNCLTAQLCSPMKGELRWRGPNSISKFHHHNINGRAVDDT
jgi:hypothetical protein